MKTNFIARENNIAKFSMEFSAEEFTKAIVKAYQEEKKNYNIDGFRKGKAPRKMIENHYGAGIFYEAAVNGLFEENYSKTLSELDLEVIAAPQADFSEIAEGKPLTITISVAVYPVIEVKDYKGVEVEQIIPEVSDEDVDKEIAAIQKRNARIVSVDRPVKDGDTVILDYSGFVGEEQFEGGTAQNQELKIGSGMFIPGFEEQLIDAKVDEQVDVKVTFPEEYQAKNLAGKDAVFHCTVHEIKEEQLPELDDEFAKDVSEYDTLDELKASTKEDIMKAAETNVVNAAKDSLIKKVYEKNKFEPPVTMVKDEIDRMINEVNQQLSYQGMGIEQYLEFTGSSIEKMREELKPEAETRVATRVMLRSIAEAEKVEVTDEDMQRELERLAEVYRSDVEQIKGMLGEDSLGYFRKDIVITKVIDMLYDEAKVKKVKPSEVSVDENKEEKDK